MKILQVFDFFSLPHGGGTVEVISKLSKALAQHGHEVTICTGDFELDQEYINSLPHVKFKVFHSHFNKFGMYVAPSLKTLDIENYDVIHFHCCRSFQNIALGIKAIAYKVPYIIDAHGSTVDRGAKNIIRGYYDYIWGEKFYHHASKVIAETEIGITEWKRLGVPESKIALMRSFIDTEEFNELPELGTYSSEHDIQEKIILFLGRINKQKGLEFLVRSFAELLKVRQDVRLVIAGADDGYLNELWSIIEKLGIQRHVSLAGFVTGQEKISLLVDAEMLIQPSMYEAGARPSIEALLCNTPVIVTRNTGAGKEIKEANAGFTVGYGNIKELSDAMFTVLDFPELARYALINGKRYIKENLSLESQINKYEQLYSEVIN